MQQHEARDEVFEQQATLSVGKQLRAAREARGQTIESLARGLRLNPKYLEALEADAFDSFPAQPYVRVYIRSLAQHLGLDALEILNLYRRQLGADASYEDDSGRTRVDMAAISAQKQKSNWPALVLLLLLLGLVLLVIHRMNPAVPTAQSEQDSVEVVAESEWQQEQAGDTDSAHQAAAAPAKDAAIAAVKKTAEKTVPALDPAPAPAERTDTPPAPGDSLILTVSARRDSAWIHIFTDGRGWTNFIRPGRPRVFRARDSLNVQVGYNANILYELNGVAITPSSLKGVAIFRIDHDSITEWSSATWRRAFRDRVAAE